MTSCNFKHESSFWTVFINKSTNFVFICTSKSLDHRTIFDCNKSRHGFNLVAHGNFFSFINVDLKCRIRTVMMFGCIVMTNFISAARQKLCCDSHMLNLWKDWAIYRDHQPSIFLLLVSRGPSRQKVELGQIPVIAFSRMLFVGLTTWNSTRFIWCRGQLSSHEIFQRDTNQITRF